MIPSSAAKALNVSIRLFIVSVEFAMRLFWFTISDRLWLDCSSVTRAFWARASDSAESKSLPGA